MKKLKGKEKAWEIKRLQEILKSLLPRMKDDTVSEADRCVWRNTLRDLEEI